MFLPPRYIIEAQVRGAACLHKRSIGGEDVSAIRVAALQIEPEPGNMQGNLEQLVELMHRAAENGANLIVAPEMVTTGYCWSNRSAITKYVEPVPGPTTDAVEQAASRTGTHVVFGMAEIDQRTKIFYNSAILVGPGGLVGHYRKIQPYAAEPRWAKHGDLGFPVFDAGGVRIGMAICMDAMFPETIRVMALKGADVICLPTNWFGEAAPSPFWRARAWENGVYLIAANRWGQERGTQFAGGSCVIDPFGRVLSAVEDANGFVISEVDPNLAKTRRNAVLDGRRPSAYHDIPLDPYRWNPMVTFGLYDDMTLPPGREAKVTVLQIEPASNWDEWFENVRPSGEGCDLLVVPPPEPPESVKEAHSMATTIPGPVTDRLVRLAAETGGSVVTEVIEHAECRIYRTVVLVDPSGPVARHRSIHLLSSDTSWAHRGDEWTCTDIKFGRVGLVSGADLLYPETARCLALRGCDIMACPSAGVMHKDLHGMDWSLARVRAGENNTFLAFANLAGSGKKAMYSGGSGVFGPDTFERPARESVVGKGLGCASLWIDVTRPDTSVPVTKVRAKPLLAMRQTHWFDPLVSQ